YALAYGVVGQAADAEEVVADAFGQAWRRAGDFDPARGSAGAWLATIARTRALDLARSPGRRGRALGRAALGSGDVGLALRVASREPADARVERGETRVLVTRALADLPEAQRSAIELAYFGGLSQSEIAERLGEPLGTVKTRMRSGMEKLRAALGP